MWRKINKHDRLRGWMLMVRCKHEKKPIFGVFDYTGAGGTGLMFHESIWPGYRRARTPDSITHYWAEKGKGK